MPSEAKNAVRRHTYCVSESIVLHRQRGAMECSVRAGKCQTGIMFAHEIFQIRQTLGEMVFPMSDDGIVKQGKTEIRVKMDGTER